MIFRMTQPQILKDSVHPRLTANYSCTQYKALTLVSGAPHMPHSTWGSSSENVEVDTRVIDSLWERPESLPRYGQQLVIIWLFFRVECKTMLALTWTHFFCIGRIGIVRSLLLLFLANCVTNHCCWEVWKVVNRGYVTCSCLMRKVLANNIRQARQACGYSEPHLHLYPLSAPQDRNRRASSASY